MKYGWRIALGLGLQLPATLLADQFHANNLILGERAMGLGGAFCAISDDASAIIYNPAGIGFALSNDISGSANAFYKKEIRYKKAIGSNDFVEKSGGTLAPFFGGMQRLENVSKGLAFAFGLYTLDSEIKDQNDLVEDIVLSDTRNLKRFHRTSNIRGSTTGAGIAAAKRVHANVSVGLSLSLLTIDELVQDYQDVIYDDTSSADDSTFLQANYRTRLKASALESGLGVQAAMGSWTLGLSAKLRTLMSDSWDISLDQRSYDSRVSATIDNSSFLDEIKGVLGEMPSEARMGVAWYPNPEFLWSFDIAYRSAAKSEKAPTIFNREAIANFHTGFEYYVSPSVPVRLGLFTNYDSTKKIDKTQSKQADHVDYIGQSLFLGWVQPNSQISGGVIYQTGKGEAQKLASTAVQEVEAYSITAALSATHLF